MELYRENDADETRVLTDKEFVLSIYPRAIVDAKYIVGYSVYALENGDPFSLTIGNSEEAVWDILKSHIEKETLRKLEA